MTMINGTINGTILSNMNFTSNMYFSEDTIIIPNLLLMLNPKLIVTGNLNTKVLEVFGNSVFHGWTISYTECLLFGMIFGLIIWNTYLNYKLKNYEKNKRTTINR